MKKTELHNKLRAGASLEDVLTFSDGQECLIYKGSFFRVPHDEIIYIPDITLNDIPISHPVTKKEIRHILAHCYTKEEFLNLCDGDEALAYRLFCYIDWQHPSSAYPEVAYEDEEDQRQAREIYTAALQRSCKEVNAA